MELSHLIQLISELPENSDLSYVRGESKCVFVKIDKNENRLHAKTPDSPSTKNRLPNIYK